MRMENSKFIPLTFIFLPLLLLSSFGGAEGYKNYTVGDSLGWYDNLENPKVDYQKWTANKNFTLGDFLIFNSDNNHSVIQTYNFTTYNLCDYQDSLENDTIEWSSDDPSSTTPHPISVAVPLRKVGMTYFFSSDYDGEQCQNGQHFKIDVTYGKGLPKTLSDDSPAPVSPESGDDAAPDTLVPSNFDHPKDISDDGDDTNNEPSKSVSLFDFSKLFGVQLHGLLFVVGFFLFRY